MDVRLVEWLLQQRWLWHWACQAYFLRLERVVLAVVPSRSCVLDSCPEPRPIRIANLQS